MLKDLFFVYFEIWFAEDFSKMECCDSVVAADCAEAWERIDRRYEGEGTGVRVLKITDAAGAVIYED